MKAFIKTVQGNEQVLSIWRRKSSSIHFVGYGNVGDVLARNLKSERRGDDQLGNTLRRTLFFHFFFTNNGHRRFVSSLCATRRRGP
jgi:hypothetical protein